MNIVLNEINVVIVRNSNISTDLLDRGAIKSILTQEYDDPPKYLEVPQIAIFDYLMNPEFPVQLNFQGRKQVFVLNGNNELHLDTNNELIQTYSDILVQLNQNIAGSLGGNGITAIGYNISLAVTASDREQLFTEALSRLSSLRDSVGSFYAGGFTIVRRDQGKSYELSVKPVIPEFGTDFLQSYIVNINEHNQPPEGNWETNMDSKLIEFRDNSLRELHEIAIRNE